MHTLTFTPKTARIGEVVTVRLPGARLERAEDVGDVKLGCKGRGKLPGGGAKYPNQDCRGCKRGQDWTLEPPGTIKITVPRNARSGRVVVKLAGGGVYQSALNESGRLTIVP